MDYIEWSEFDDRAALVNSSGIRIAERTDVVRYHLGMEYLAGIYSDTALFLRTGWMLEEDNALTSLGTENSRKRLPKPDDINHYTFGIGIARPHFQLDFGFDYSEQKTQYILSTVIYF